MRAVAVRQTLASRLLKPIQTNGQGREAALKQNRLRNTFPRNVVQARINRFLTNKRKRPSSYRRR